MNKQTKIHIPLDKEKQLEIENEIKSFSIPYKYNTFDFTIYELVKLYTKGEKLHEQLEFNETAAIDIDDENDEKGTLCLFIPQYQREFVWNTDEISRFVESLFLGMPVQPIFVAQLEEDGLLEIIDGSQRIRALRMFVNDEIKLQNLKKITSLNGISFSDLSKPRRNNFIARPMRMHSINESATIEIRKDIFDRLNTSGKKLSDSQIRKGIDAHEGFFSFIETMSKNNLFLQLCPISPHNQKQGEATELLLRFFAYTEKGTDNPKRGKPFLDEYLSQKTNNDGSINGWNKETLEKYFTDALNFVKSYFPLGFRKTSTANSVPRVRFEAIALGVHFALLENPNLTVTNVEWLNSEEFKKVTTSDSSNNPGRLKERVDFTKHCLLGGDPKTFIFQNLDKPQNNNPQLF